MYLRTFSYKKKKDNGRECFAKLPEKEAQLTRLRKIPFYVNKWENETEISNTQKDTQKETDNTHKIMPVS